MELVFSSRLIQMVDATSVEVADDFWEKHQSFSNIYHL
jgi:hypothetical protein